MGVSYPEVLSAPLGGWAAYVQPLSMQETSYHPIIYDVKSDNLFPSAQTSNGRRDGTGFRRNIRLEIILRSIMKTDCLPPTRLTSASRRRPKNVEELGKCRCSHLGRFLSWLRPKMADDTRPEHAAGP
jgi:hypothetical protein